MIRPTAFTAIVLASAAPMIFLTSTEPAYARASLSDTPFTGPQVAATVLEGTITDPSGAPVVGAKVSLVQSPGPGHYETLTDMRGHYRIAGLVAGTYTVTAEQSSFKPVTSRITVVNGEIAHADIQFALASLSANIVVTATNDIFGEKSGIPIEQVPQSIQVLDEQDFLDRNVRSIGDMLSAVPSATPGASRVSTYQAYSQKIRGFAAYPIYNGFYERYFYNVDPSATSNIEEVQVLKGPSAVLYGQGEVGGVVNITTKHPQHDFAGSVSVIGGSYDQASGSFDVTGPVRGVPGLYFRGTGEIERSGTYVNYLPENRDNGAFDATWEHGDQVAIHFVGEWEERRTLRNPGLPAVGTVVWNGVARIPSSTFLGDPPLNGSSGHSGFTVTGVLLQAWAPIKLNNVWTLTPRVSYSTFDSDYLEINLGAVASDLVTVSRTGRWDPEHNKYPIEELDLDGTAKAIGTTHHLTFGVQNNLYRIHYFQENFATVPSINTLTPVYGGVSEPPYTPSSVVFNNYDGWAVYEQDRIDLTDSWNVIAGIRGDFYLNHHSAAPNFTTTPTILDSSFNHVTWQIGSTYRLSQDWSLFGSYASGFNIEPAVNTLTFNGVPLSPEDSCQGEGGLRVNNGPVSASASFFQINRTNAVTVDPNHPGYSINNGNVRARGTELEANARMRKGLFIETGYAYTDAQVIKSNSGNLGFEVADTPRNRADLFLRYLFTGLPLQLRGGINYVGNRAFADTANVTIGPNLLANTVTLPNYTNVELGANYTYGHARFDVNVENIANKVYYARDFNNYAVIPGDPRQFNARVTYRF